jgi:hypothetical protein
VRVATDSGSRIDIGGNANLFAETYASGGSGANAINTGTAEIVANGGTITVGDDVVVYARRLWGQQHRRRRQCERRNRTHRQHRQG